MNMHLLTAATVSSIFIGYYNIAPVHSFASSLAFPTSLSNTANNEILTIKLGIINILLQF